MIDEAETFFLSDVAIVSYPCSHKEALNHASTSAPIKLIGSHTCKVERGLAMKRNGIGKNGKEIGK